MHTILECSQHPLLLQSGSKFHPAFFVWFWHILIFSSFCNSMQCFAYVNLSIIEAKHFRVIGRTIYSRMLYVFFCLTLILSLKSSVGRKKICVKNERAKVFWEIFFFKIVGVVWELLANPAQFHPNSKNSKNLTTCFHEFSVTMNLRIFCETEFVYLFLCTVNVNKNIRFRWKIRRFVVTEFVKLSDEPINFP